MTGNLGRIYDIYFGILRGPSTKFICDANLSRLCRWMRVLGIDTALESVDANELRSGKFRPAASSSQLFRQARKEKRVILTTSKRLQQLASCPQSFLVKSGKLDDILMDICKEFAIELDPQKFLTVLRSIEIFLLYHHILGYYFVYLGLRKVWRGHRRKLLR